MTARLEEPLQAAVTQLQVAEIPQQAEEALLQAVVTPEQIPEPIPELEIVKM